MECKITWKWKEIYKKNKCNLFQRMMWCYNEDWGMKNTKLCNIHEQREKHSGAFDFYKRRKQFIWGTEEKNEENETKRFLNQIFSEKKKKNHPAALIKHSQKTKQSFCFDAFEFSCLLFQLKRFSLLPISHGSVMIHG